MQLLAMLWMDRQADFYCLFADIWPATQTLPPLFLVLKIALATLKILRKLSPQVKNRKFIMVFLSCRGAT